MLKTLLTSLVLPLLMTHADASSLAAEETRSRSAFEQLEGFDAIVINHINAVMGSENLPSAMGLPVEPGVYVVVSNDRVTVFDEDVAAVSGGVITDASEVAPESRTNAPRSVFDGMYGVWRRLVDEARIAALELPTRVLLAGDATLPAKTVISVGYAAVETRPTATPNVYMLVNGGRAGLRARPVFLMPPEGLLLPPGQRPLGLQVMLLGQGQYRVKTASNSLKSDIEVTSADGLRKVLEDIKKRNPSKDAAVLDVSEGGTLGDLLNVIMLAQESFPKVVVSSGQRVIIG